MHKNSRNFGRKSNEKVNFGSVRREYLGSPLVLVHFDQSDHFDIPVHCLTSLQPFFFSPPSHSCRSSAPTFSSFLSHPRRQLSRSHVRSLRLEKERKWLLRSLVWWWHCIITCTKCLISCRETAGCIRNLSSWMVTLPFLSLSTSSNNNPNTCFCWSFIIPYRAS